AVEAQPGAGLSTGRIAIDGNDVTVLDGRAAMVAAAQRMTVTGEEQDEAIAGAERCELVGDEVAECVPGGHLIKQRHTQRLESEAQEDLQDTPGITHGIVEPVPSVISIDSDDDDIGLPIAGNATGRAVGCSNV